MTTLEQQLRAALEDLAPDADTPSDIRAALAPSIRREGTRRFATRSLAVAGLAACMAISGAFIARIAGGGSDTVQPAKSPYVSTTLAHINGMPSPQYVVGSGVVDGRRWQFASYLDQGRPALAHDEITQAGGSAHAGWTVGQVADFSMDAISDPMVLWVSGFVPATAHNVTVELPDGTRLTVPAVATPTSKAVRFFVVAFRGHEPLRQNPKVTATDEAGHKLAPASAHGACPYGGLLRGQQSPCYPAGRSWSIPPSTGPATGAIARVVTPTARPSG